MRYPPLGIELLGAERILELLDAGRRDEVSVSLGDSEDAGASLDEAVYRAEKAWEGGSIPFFKLISVIQDVGAIRKERGIPVPDRGKAILASLDAHTAGADVMSLYLETAGFTVVRLDESVPDGIIVLNCMDEDVRVLCLSGQFVDKAVRIVSIADMLREGGIRDRLVLNAGGYSATPISLEKAGCDVIANSGADAVRQIVRLVDRARDQTE